MVGSVLNSRLAAKSQRLPLDTAPADARKVETPSPGGWGSLEPPPEKAQRQCAAQKSILLQEVGFLRIKKCRTG